MEHISVLADTTALPENIVIKHVLIAIFVSITINKIFKLAMSIYSHKNTCKVFDILFEDIKRLFKNKPIQTEKNFRTIIQIVNRSSLIILL